LFDEVNEDIQPFKPTFMTVDVIEEIDTHCLDYEEAMAITKQKIFDLAEQMASHQYKYKKAILAVLCTIDHFIIEKPKMEDSRDSN
jgi:hypothetical protein